MQVTRREFTIMGAAGLVVTGAAGTAARSKEPWYRQVKRWGQINLTEDNVTNFDVGFWRRYWKETRIQGVMLNAGGDFAFYPTAIPGQGTVANLNGRDFFGELADIARADGLVLVARMAFRAPQELMKAHPEWMNVDANGTTLSTVCMNGGYYHDHCPKILKEVATRYRPDGFTASGWGHNYSLCYCKTCTTLFKGETGLALPAKKDWSDPVYRTWVDWNADQVIALWDHNNKVTTSAGGPDCIWVGQMIGSIMTRGLKRICDRAEFVMVDHQSREADGGFQDGATAAKAYSSLGGWTKPMTTCTALYDTRLTSNEDAEWQTWMYQGIAGGQRPWWHTVGAYTEDKRRFAGVRQIMQWHEKNEQYLFDRTPGATVGVVWSDTNNIFYGREKLADRVHAPWIGITHALVRAGIPFVPVHADQIDSNAAHLRTLILPGVGALSDKQVASIRRFVGRGGGLFATGQSGLYDQYGDRRSDYAFSDLYGAHFVEPSTEAEAPAVSEAYLLKAMTEVAEKYGLFFPPDEVRRQTFDQTYLRLTPELRAAVDGPHSASEPPVAPGAARHPLLRGLEGTDIVFFGGKLNPIRLALGAQALLTFIPAVPSNPPESAYMRVPKTDIPGLVVNTLKNGSRVVFMPANLDFQYFTTQRKDQAQLLANAARWTAQDDVPIAVDDTGVLDFNIYHQPGRTIVHIGNVGAAGSSRPQDKILPVGPVRVRVKLKDGVTGSGARLLVADQAVPVRARDGWSDVEIPSIRAHEVLLLT